MPQMRNPFSKPKHHGDRYRQQPSRDQPSPAAVINSRGYSPERQSSRLGGEQRLLESSERPPVPSKSGRTSSQNRRQRSPDYRAEQTDPYPEKRRTYVSSEDRPRDEGPRGTGRYHPSNQPSVGHYNKSRNHVGSRDRERLDLTEDPSDPETNSAEPERWGSTVNDVYGQSTKNPVPPESHLRINVGDKFKFYDATSSLHDKPANMQSWQSSNEHRTGLEQPPKGASRSGLAQSHPSHQDEAVYDDLGNLRTGDISLRPVDGGGQQQWSENITQLSTYGIHPLQFKDEMQRVPSDHAVRMNKNLGNHQADAPMPKGNHQGSIENHRLEGDDPITAHQSARQSLRNESSGFRQVAVDPQQTIDELCSKLKSAQDSSISLSQQLNLNTDHLRIAQQTVEHTKSELVDVLKKLQSTREEADRLKRSREECIQKINDLKQTLAERATQLVERATQLTTLERNRAIERSQHAEVIANLEQKIQDTKDDADARVISLTTKYSCEADQLQNTHEVAMSRLALEKDNEVSIHQQEILSIKTEAETKETELRVACDQKISELMGQHQETVTQMRADLTRVREEEGEKRQKLKTVHDQQRTQIIQQHEQAVSRINEELAQVLQNEESKISRLKDAHAQNTRKLRVELNERNASVLTRDDKDYQGELFTSPNLPSRPDEQIRGKFSEIEQVVDSLGRLQWKQEPAVWTRQVLKSIGGDRVDRVLKKAIVQDLVWCILFNYIFCSPFRVFGVEGRLLEKEWNEQCGQDAHSDDAVFSWPEPGFKTERWRYMTVKECREVLRPPVPSEWDPRMRLRKGFMDSLKECVSEMKASLEQIADCTTADQQMVERLVKKAATVWLDFTIHRCRIVVRFKDSVALSMEEKVAAAQRSSLELTVVPLVGRYGNVTGADLDTYKTIDRCAGESTVLER